MGDKRLIFLLIATWLPLAYAGHGTLPTEEESDRDAPPSSIGGAQQNSPQSNLAVLPGSPKNGKEISKEKDSSISEKILPSQLAQSVSVIVYAEAKDRGSNPDDERWKTLPDRLQLVARRNSPTVRFVRLPNLSIASLSNSWKWIDQAVRGERLAVSSVTLILATTSRAPAGETELLTDDGYLSGKQIGNVVSELSDKRLLPSHGLSNPIETIVFSNWTETLDCKKFPGQVAGFSGGAIRNFDQFLNWYGNFFELKKAASLPLRAMDWHPAGMETLCTPPTIRNAANLGLPLAESAFEISQ